MNPAALDWVVSSLPGATRVLRTERLTGGMTSVMHALTVHGHDRRVVLRQWIPEHPPAEDADDPTLAVAREAAVLTALDDCGLPVPRLLAADETGAHAGYPSVLMTHLSGGINLTPRDVGAWTAHLAQMLVRIHALRPSVSLPPFDSWLQMEDFDVPRWSPRPDVWRAAIGIANQPPPVLEQQPVVHHDYQPFNVLWSASGDRISGLVDWVWASQGPADEDVTHCRLNLCLLTTPDIAEDFRRRYEAESGRVLDPWWDVASLVDYLGGWSASGLQQQAGSRLRVDAVGINDRVDALLASVMKRL
jgi:aminoglycoside phosphotransferase (APT) family kinase protein